jgi:hypothetical protein
MFHFAIRIIRYSFWLLVAVSFTVIEHERRSPRKEGGLVFEEAYIREV